MGEPEGAALFLRGDIAPMPAALCILAAVRAVRHRIRRRSARLRYLAADGTASAGS
ncbi:hypothetical protein [Microbispora bryophytorum]|uniref:hypothetical protein n=1 Tax=Microbispora bryophytorum TaxID=1460882 RepID=UPI00340C72A1